MTGLRFFALAGLLVSGGCVYYNGMYNAQRLANKAEKAERDGRRFDAQNYWAQAEVKADSVISRHPTSSWADDALLIKGTALTKRNRCEEAIPFLERVVFGSTDHELVDQSNLMLGECYLSLGDPAGAQLYLAPVITSADSALQAKARGLYGSALNTQARYADALEVLDQLKEPRLDGERAIALAGAGYIGAAMELSDTLIARRDTFVVWDSLLGAIGRHDPATASELTDRLIADADSLRPEVVAGLYLNDGRRWVSTDPDRAAERFRLAAADTAARRNGGMARIELIKLEFRQSNSPADLTVALEIIEVASLSPGADGLIARRYGETVQRLTGATDTITATTPNGDLEFFLMAETARDSLEAFGLSRWYYRQLTTRWPASEFAPKALLAMAALDVENAHVYREMMAYAYPNSPYMMYLDGDITAAYWQLEDSLRTYTFSRMTQSQQPQQRRPGAGRRRARTDIEDMNPEDQP